MDSIENNRNIKENRVSCRAAQQLQWESMADCFGESARRNDNVGSFKPERLEAKWDIDELKKNEKGMESMKKTQHDILLRIVRLVSVLLMTGVFGGGWYWYYANHLASPYYQNGNYLVLGLYLVLFITFAKVYDAFELSINRISEMAYSQALAAVASDGVMLLVTWLLTKHFPALLPLVLVFAGQCVVAVIWAYLANHWYYKTFPPKKTAIVYDSKIGLQRLIQEYGLEKKYDVQTVLPVNECVSNLDLVNDAQTVFISGVHSHERNIILKHCVANNIEVLVIPRIGDVIMSSARSIHMFHLPILQIRRYNASLEYLFVKRLLDIVLSLIAIIITSPFMLAVAIAIKLYDRGPVIYSQIRLTKDEKQFHIYKFRSMRTDAEKDGVARLSTGEKDERITPVGKVIRKLRLDELPQLFNILKGELSICGPRPERPEIASQYCEEMPEFALRLQAKAGLTGYAQVYGKYNTTPYDKLQMDLMYIAHPSIVQDLKIMLATVKILFMSESTEGVQEGQTTAAK